MRKRRISLAIVAAAAVGLLTTGPAKADAVADFYKGKTVTIYVGLAAGGIYSIMAQTMSKICIGVGSRRPSSAILRSRSA